MHMRSLSLFLHRRCRHAGGQAALWLSLVVAAPMAHAASGIKLLAPDPASAATLPLRPREVLKVPTPPSRRPIDESASLALLLGGLVALWRAAERHACSGRTNHPPHRPTPKGSPS